MFDENFSFHSPTSNTTPPSAYDDSIASDISPFTSRSSSPRPYLGNSSISAPTGVSDPDSLSPSHFPSASTSASASASYFRPRHPSITALTAQFESHALTSPDPHHSRFTSTPAIPSSSPTTPSSNATSFVDTPASDISLDPSPWDLPIASSPRPSFSYVGAADPASAYASFALRRRQRQALVRLQCVTRRMPDLMMLIEECHPSSLPVDDAALWGAKRQASAGGRVEKDRAGTGGATTVARKTPRMRKRATQ